MENDNNNNRENEFRTDNNNYFNLNNNVKLIDLYKEKEFLSDEYQKFKQKYLVYKFKYHEFKKTVKLFLNYMTVIPFGNNISNFFENLNLNDKKIPNLLGSKRQKSKSNNEKEEFRTTDYLYNNINAIRNININNQIRKKSEESFKDLFKIPSIFNNNTFNSLNDYDENYNEEENIKIIETEEKDRVIKIKKIEIKMIKIIIVEIKVKKRKEEGKKLLN